jgi:hypothetical protein
MGVIEWDEGRMRIGMGILRAFEHDLARSG